MIKVFILMFAVTAFIAWIWSNAIVRMAKDHPDYKGQDWLTWDLTEEEKKDIL